MGQIGHCRRVISMAWPVPASRGFLYTPVRTQKARQDRSWRACDVCSQLGRCRRFGLLLGEDFLGFREQGLLLGRNGGLSRFDHVRLVDKKETFHAALALANLTALLKPALERPDIKRLGWIIPVH